MRFEFRPVLSVAVAAALAVLIALGVWQLQRLEWKRGLIAQITEREASAPIPLDEALAREARGENLEFQPVYVEGAYRHESEALVFGARDGAPGVFVFTPLAFGGDEDRTRTIFINRGFAPQEFRDPEARADGAIDGAVRVEGVLRHPEKRQGFAAALAPEDQPADNLFFVRDPARLAAAKEALGLSGLVSDAYVESRGGENPARWPEGAVTDADLPNRHFEYALTWFGLAAGLIGVYLGFSVKRG